MKAAFLRTERRAQHPVGFELKASLFGGVTGVLQSTVVLQQLI